MITVACVLRQGGKVGYDASWVEKLKNSVGRNLTLPHRFVCLSDCDVPCDRIALEPVGAGFWSKLQLFRPGQFDTPVLYIDLDALICQNIDQLIELVAGQKFVMWLEPRTLVHSSALLYWEGDHSYLWEQYLSQPAEYWAKHYTTKQQYGDQALLAEYTQHTLFQDHVPTEWFHLVGKHDHTFDFKNVKILQFIKTHSKPSNMLTHPMVQAHWR